ncbi:hypothetical protein TNCV_2989731 [Trichonephila clavipes]|nr:hypothetical protein TNCV_2989731 [Trichonephila clavipes]
MEPPLAAIQIYDRGSHCHPAIHSARHSPVVAPVLRYFEVPESGAISCSRHVQMVKDLVALLAKKMY